MKCPYCNSEKLIRNQDGFLVCTNCGTVIEHSNITGDFQYNIKSSDTEGKLTLPIEWSQPLRKAKKCYPVELVIHEFWSKFVETVKQRSPQLLQYISEFEKWLYDEGIKVLLYKAFTAQKRGCRYVAKPYIYGMVRRGKEGLLINLFAMWLHLFKGFSLYSLKHEYKLITNYEGVYSWLRCYRKKLENMSNSK